MFLARSVRSSLALVAALSLAAQLSACAKAATSSALPSGGEAYPTSNVAGGAMPGDREETLAMLDRAEGDLTVALGAMPPLDGPGSAAAGQSVEVKKGAAQPAAGPPPPQPAAPKPRAEASSPPAPKDATVSKEKETRASEISATSGGEEGAAGSPCERACRALGSMRRATEHLCGLSGEADAMCELARSRVRNAGERVQLSCPACAG